MIFRIKEVNASIEGVELKVFYPQIKLYIPKVTGMLWWEKVFYEDRWEALSKEKDGTIEIGTYSSTKLISCDSKDDAQREIDAYIAQSNIREREKKIEKAKKTMEENIAKVYKLDDNSEHIKIHEVPEIEKNH